MEKASGGTTKEGCLLFQDGQMCNGCTKRPTLQHTVVLHRHIGIADIELKVIDRNISVNVRQHVYHCKSFT